MGKENRFYLRNGESVTNTGSRPSDKREGMRVYALYVVRCVKILVPSFRPEPIRILPPQLLGSVDRENLHLQRARLIVHECC